MDHSSDHSAEHSEPKHEAGAGEATSGAAHAEASAAEASAKKKKLIKVFVAVIAVSGIVAGGSYSFLKASKTESQKHLAQNAHGAEDDDDAEDEEAGEAHAGAASHQGSANVHGASAHAQASGHSEHGEAHAPAHGESHAQKSAHSAHGEKPAHGDGHGPGKTAGAQASHGGGHGGAAHGTAPGTPAHRTIAHDAPKKTGFLAEIQGVWGSLQSKADRLRFADEENQRLRLENANLRLKLAAVQYDRGLKQGFVSTSKNGSELQKQAGARTARTPASITYRPPVHLLPSQLLTLGVAYFRAREDEKAAVIFTFLVDQEESESFKLPKNYLLAGVAWYRLDNLELADKYFARVLESRDLKENLPYHAQARLWRALVAERQGKGMKTQYWMRELVDHHPHALETAWVNTKQPGDRQPAAAKASAAAEDEDQPLPKKKKPAPAGHGDEHGHSAPATKGHSGGGH